MGDLHKVSKTFVGVSIATTGMPDWTAEQTCKAVSNAIDEREKKVDVRQGSTDEKVLTLLEEYLFGLFPLFSRVSWKH
jgi:hypothetical protein